MFTWKHPNYYKQLKEERKKQNENPNHSLNEYYNRKKYLKKFYKGKP